MKFGVNIPSHLPVKRVGDHPRYARARPKICTKTGSPVGCTVCLDLNFFSLLQKGK